MNAFVITQQPAPQAGWSSQHDAVTLAPRGARSYEPAALVTHTTARNISMMVDFFEATRDQPITHSSQWRGIDLAGLQARYEALSGTAQQPASGPSLLENPRGFEAPKFYIPAGSRTNAPDALAGSLNEAGYWPTPLRMTSHPYIGDGTETAAPGDFTGTFVGD